MRNPNLAEIRKACQETIQRVKKANPGQHGKDLQNILEEACFPFDETGYHKRKIWKQEIKRACFGYDKPTGNNKRPRLDAPGQTGMFE